MTQRQKNMIRDAGMDPADWIVRHEDARYLHLAGRKGVFPIRIIDKTSNTTIKMP